VSANSPASPEKRKNGRIKSPPIRGAIILGESVVHDEAWKTTKMTRVFLRILSLSAPRVEVANIGAKRLVYKR
jgi:hypothetical protein